MTGPLLGDPGSMSALAASLRLTAVQLAADGERLAAALAEASPGWRGPRSVLLRRRLESTAAQARAMAAALDGAGRSLQAAATDLAASIAHLRALEEEARAAGLEVRDGTVSRGWGITGVADAGSAREAEVRRERLQERLHQAVTTLGRQRAVLARDLTHAEDLLSRSAGVLRG